MADDRADKPIEKPSDKPPSPTPLPERERAAAGELGRAMRGFIGNVQDPSPGDKIPAHTPTIPEESDSSSGTARGRSPGDKPLSFSERLEAMRQLFREIGSPEQCRDEPEPEGR